MELCQNNSFQQNFSKIWSGNNHNDSNKTIMFSSDRMSSF